MEIPFPNFTLSSGVDIVYKKEVLLSTEYSTFPHEQKLESLLIYCSYKDDLHVHFKSN